MSMRLVASMVCPDGYGRNTALPAKELHHDKEYGGRAREEPSSTHAQFVSDATALKCTPQVQALDGQ